MTEDPQWRVQRRQKIISAASALFAKSAFDAVQMDDIAARAEVGKPTLYRYFPSKQALYLSVCEEAFQLLEARLDRAAQRCSPSDALRNMVAALVEVLGNQLATLGFLHGEDPLASQWRQLYRRRRRAIVDRLRNVLSEGIAQGEFGAVDPEVVPDFLIGVIRGGIAVPGTKSKDHLVQTMMTFVLWGLSPRQTPVTLRKTAGARACAAPTPMRARR